MFIKKTLTLMQILIQVHVKISYIYKKKLHNTISNLHSSKINYLCNHIHGRRQQNSPFKNFNVDANAHLSSC